MSEEGGGARTTLGTGSRITVGLLAGILAVLGYGIWDAGRWAGRVDSRLEIIERNLSHQDNWTDAEQRYWVLRLARLNPTLTIPD